MRQVCFVDWLTEIDGILIHINGSQEPFAKLPSCLTQVDFSEVG